MKSRPFCAISTEELLEYGVWEEDLDESTYEEEQDETWIRPILDLPVDTLECRIVVTHVRLANGRGMVAMLSNVSLDSLVLTEHCRSISLEDNGSWFCLPAYYAPGSQRYNPGSLAEWLGMSVEEVFPIQYDISHLATGLSDILKGKITAEPEKRLTKEEIWQMLFGR